MSLQSDDANSSSTDSNGTEVDISPLVQEALDAKIEKFQKTILDKCMQKALEDAEIFIDSLVAEELQIQLGDTIAFPTKPVRPKLNSPIVLDDSTAIKPIID